MSGLQGWAVKTCLTRTLSGGAAVAAPQHPEHGGRDERGDRIDEPVADRAVAVREEALHEFIDGAHHHHGEHGLDGALGAVARTAREQQKRQEGVAERMEHEAGRHLRRFRARTGNRTDDDGGDEQDPGGAVAQAGMARREQDLV